MNTPKHRGEPKTQYQIVVFESERGFGRKDWTEEFDTREEATARIKEINSHNTAVAAPDYYIAAYSEIREVVS